MQATVATAQSMPGGTVTQAAQAPQIQSVPVPTNSAATMAASTASTAPAVSTAAAPGNSQATSPAMLTSQAVPPAQQSSGNTMMAGADKGQARAEGPHPPGHTVQGTHRRMRDGLAGAVLGAMAMNRRPDLESEIRQQVDHAFRWLYWALTITAWLCLLLLLVATLPSISGIGAGSIQGRAPLGTIALLTGAGLCSGFTAWLLARRGK